MNWYDYGFRNYDPQIGKFIQMDPLADGNSDFSPYSYAANDPIGNIDYLGLDPISALSTTAETAITLSTVTITAVKATSTAISTVSLASKIISITSITLQVANTACNLINSSITTSGVGSVDPGRRFAIESRGFNHAFRSALTLGMSEWFTSDPLKDYSTDQEKLWYLQGRLKGDAAAAAFSLAETDVGTGGLVTTGATGVGAVVSGGVIAHGMAVSIKTGIDIALTWEKIYKLNMAGSSGSLSKSYKSPSNNSSSAKTKYHKDFSTKNTKNYSAYFKSEREARNLARTKLGKNPVEVEPNKWRSADGKWQYRAKPGDIKDKHIHLEEINPFTGEILQNYHLRWK
ncbi:MAG: RHS repeat-associated core domain-containing protein [Agriterribacter sp.]